MSAEISRNASPSKAIKLAFHKPYRMENSTSGSSGLSPSASDLSINERACSMDALVSGAARISGLLKQHSEGTPVSADQIKAASQETKDLLAQAHQLLENT